MIGDVAKEMECVGICEHEVLSWANPFLQSYLAAVHLSLTLQSSIFKKTLSFRCETSTKGRRRPLREEFELTQRFAVGLLFQNRADLLWLHPDDNLNNILLIKQTSLFTHIRNHKFRLLKPSQILNLCHFIYEGSLTTFGQSADTTTSRLARQVFDSLPENLTFNGVPLTPADVHAIKNIVEYGEEQRFSLDLTDSGIQVSGLRSLVGLNTVKTYRACIVDVISLWEELEKQKEDGFTCDAVTKFKIDPFKATQVCHVEHLAKLVDIHTNKRLPECQMSSIFAEGVAAVRDLHKLELE
uniref:BTB domain-containing protein n=1 Tax=Knipowitschia caucasica TaxID=637954 RepID=A0AAV2KGF2_KNICA